MKDKTIRTLSVQTISFNAILGVVSMFQPEDSYAYAPHPVQGDKPEHWHLVAKLAKPTKVGKFRSFVMGIDPHSSTDNARSVDGALRYLLHLDSPEKGVIDRAGLVVHNWPGYEDVLARKSRSCGNVAATELEIFDDLTKRLSGRGPRADDFRELLKLGYTSSRVRSVISALHSLRQWHAVEFVKSRESSDRITELEMRQEELDFWACAEPAESADDGVFLADVEVV